MNRHRKWMRMKRARRTRKHIQELKLPRLCVHRTPRHIYAQVLSDDGTRTVASASTVEKNVRLETKYGGNCRAAELVGRLVAERAILAGVERVAFDRSGFKFHGRVAALAKSARQAGLVF